jgi:hypothetical protein
VKSRRKEINGPPIDEADVTGETEDTHQSARNFADSGKARLPNIQRFGMN